MRGVALQLLRYQKILEHCVSACLACANGVKTTCSTSCTLKGAHPFKATANARRFTPASLVPRDRSNAFPVRSPNSRQSPGGAQSVSAHLLGCWSHQPEGSPAFSAPPIPTPSTTTLIVQYYHPLTHTPLANT